MTKKTVSLSAKAAAVMISLILACGTGSVTSLAEDNAGNNETQNVLEVSEVTGNSSESKSVSVLKRDEFVDKALEHSSVISELEEQRNSMLSSIAALSEAGKQLRQLEDLVPAYQQLGKKYSNEMSVETHKRYYQLMIMQANGSVMTPEEIQELSDLTAALTASGELETMMTLTEYYEYKKYESLFASIGIGSYRISKKQMYEIFVVPTKITPMELQAVVEQLNRAIESADDSIVSGMKQLYDSAVMMTEIASLLEGNYRSSQNALDQIQKKYDKGLVSGTDYLTALNNVSMAKLNLDVMKRNINNLKMNMNVQMGENVQNMFNVEDVYSPGIKLPDLEYFVDAALKNRADMKNAAAAIENQQNKVSIIDAYFSDNSDEMVSESMEVESLQLKYEILAKQVEEEIRNKYNTVMLAQENKSLANLNLDDAYRQLDELQVSVDNGFVVESKIIDFNLLIEQKINNKADAVRDYGTALSDLYISAGLALPY